MDKKLEEYLQDPLYKKAAEMWLETHKEQIVKGAYKYPEPLGKANWTPQQLVKHAMQENADQANYIVALGEKIKEMEHDICRLIHLGGLISFNAEEALEFVSLIEKYKKDPS